MKQDVTKAVILVGGWGTRLRPLTYTLPKPLISFCNKPILRYQIEKLVNVGIKEVILALNYHSELIINEVSKYKEEFGINIIYSKEDKPLGTAGPLALVKEHLKGSSFFLLNSDICCNVDLFEMKKSFMESDCIGTILSYPVEDPTKYGLISVDGKRILSFLEKPKRIEGSGPWLINAGMYILSSKVLDYIDLKETSIENEIFPRLAEEKVLDHFQFSGYWMDIGQPRDYLIGQMMELNNSKTTNKYFDVNNNVVIGEQAKIGKGCILKNCTIFDYALIEDNCKIENSIIGWGCHIQKGCAIRSMSVLGEGVIVEKGLEVDGALTKPKTRITSFTIPVTTD